MVIQSGTPFLTASFVPNKKTTKVSDIINNNYKPLFSSCRDTAEGAADISQRTRRAVRRLVQCDVLRDPLLSCTQTHTFDCIVSSLCLEAAATDMDSYSEALLRVVRHLRPGGTFVMMGVLGCDSYTAGGVEFPCLHLTMDKVAECVERAKLTDCCWTFVNKWPSIEDDVNGNGWTGAFMLKAERK